MVQQAPQVVPDVRIAVTNFTRYRWHPVKGVWQFWEAAWGGWCVLGTTIRDVDPPMTFEEGCLHLMETVAANANALRLTGQPQTPAIMLLSYHATKGEPERAYEAH